MKKADKGKALKPASIADFKPMKPIPPSGLKPLKVKQGPPMPQGLAKPAKKPTQKLDFKMTKTPMEKLAFKEKKYKASK